MDYAYTRVRTADRDFGAVYSELAESNFSGLAPAQLWGAFAGLFGIGSNEMIIVTAGDVDDVDQALRDIPRVVETETTYLQPTVRPESFETRTTPGLYVFRFFDVRFDDVEEIASLSKYAWTHFEDTPDYKAVPQALFSERQDGATEGVMLLCTWYDGLNSWQRSRTPAPEATENFRRRHALTSGTVAFATRLLGAAN